MNLSPSAPEKHAGGRPTKYLPEFCDMVDDYLEECQDVEREGKKPTVKLPTIEGFAIKFLGVNKHALYDWEKEYPEFSHALDKIREEQKERLLNNGLAERYNSTIAKLVLSANHGMREKSDITSDDKVLPTITITGMKVISDGDNIQNEKPKADTSS